MNKAGGKALHVGVAWFDEVEWEKLRQVTADAEDLGASYQDWCAQAEETIARVASEGHQIEKVPIQVEQLLGWCVAEGRPLDQAARAEYAVERLRKMHEEPGA